MQEARELLQTVIQALGVIADHESTSAEVLPNKWASPLFRRYKVNWDVALDSHNKRMGIGVIVRDYKGRATVAQSKTFNTFYEPVAAEATAWRWNLAVIWVCKISFWKGIRC